MDEHGTPITIDFSVLADVVATNIQWSNALTVANGADNGLIYLGASRMPSLESYDCFDSITPVCDGCKFLISFNDIRGWLTCSSGVWERVNITDIATKGMSKSSIESLTYDDWYTVFAPTKFNIAVYLSGADSISKIDIQPSSVLDILDHKIVNSRSFVFPDQADMFDGYDVSYRILIGDVVVQRWTPLVASPMAFLNTLPLRMIPYEPEYATLTIEAKDEFGTITRRTLYVTRAGSNVVPVYLCNSESDPTIEDIYSAATHRFIALACLDGPMLPFKTE